MNTYPIIQKYAINLTEQAKNGKFQYAEEYDTQINRTIRVLYRGVVNSPVLIDDLSEKKQAVVQSVVLKLLEIGADHEDLRAYYFSNKEIWSLNIPKLIANHNNPQSFKICLINLIKELTEKEHIILYIDPAHKVIGSCPELLAPDDMQYLLYMPVRRKNFQVIWGTDIETYKNCLGPNEANDKTIFRTKIFFKDYPSKSEFPFN